MLRYGVAPILFLINNKVDCFCCCCCCSYCPSAAAAFPSQTSHVREGVHHRGGDPRYIPGFTSLDSITSALKLTSCADNVYNNIRHVTLPASIAGLARCALHR